MSRQIFDVVMIVVLLVLYYKVLLAVVRDIVVSFTVHALLVHFRSSRYAVAEVENVATLAFGVVLQMFLFCVLAACTAFEPRWLWRRRPELQLLAYGAVLGCGEMFLGSFVGLLAIKVSSAFPQLGNPLHHWQVTLNSGWMRLFNTSIRLLPLPAAISLVILYVGVEELIIRGIVFNVLLPWGRAAAVVLSTAIFAGYQVFNLPSWRVALFPVIGALIMGPIHGLLYLAIPDIWPLVVAHITYFTVVALTFR